MIEDEELDKLALKQNEIVQVTTNESQLKAPEIQTQFSKQMDVVKENVLSQAAENDTNFVDTIKRNVKEAAVRLTEVEKDKADLQGQQIKYESEKLSTKQIKNENEQKEDKWDNKRKRRQFHYDGVKPIMEFVGVKEPMNLVFLYFLTIILTPIYLVAKLIRGTFGALIAGASDSQRGKMAKGFLWTVLCVFVLITVVSIVYLFLKWQGIDLLRNIKS